MKPYYEDDTVTLFHGDCREILPGIKADMCLADPPYGDTSLDWDRWPEGWVQAVEVALPAEASLWCFGSMRMHLDRRGDFGAWTYGQELIWEKHNGSGFASDRFKRVHEIAMHWYRGAWADLHKETPRVPGGDGTKSIRKRGQTAHTGAIGDVGYVDDGLRIVRSVLQVRSMHGKAIHPTEKPLGILTPILRYSCPPGGTVLDPTAGSGSTGMAARMLGLKAILIEGREDYCEVAAQRFTQAELSIFGGAA